MSVRSHFQGLVPSEEQFVEAGVVRGGEQMGREKEGSFRSLRDDRRGLDRLVCHLFGAMIQSRDLVECCF